MDWPTSWGPAPRWATARSPERPTFGGTVAELAVRMGRPLFPWQRYVVDVALEVTPDEAWAYDEVIVVVQRRSGKTELIKPVTAHRGGQKQQAGIWLTAQRRDNAVKRWRDATGPIERLMNARRPTVRRKIGNMSEELRWISTDSAFLPFAPNEDAMHGEDPDLVWVDELWSFGMEQRRVIQQGYKPAWSVKSGQEWKLSAAGTRRSEWLKHDRERGRAAVESGGRSRIAFFEWCVPESVAGVPVRDLPDEQLLQVVLGNHPRRDHGLRPEYLAEQLHDMGRSGFLRAYGGIDEDDDADEWVIPAEQVRAAVAAERIPEGVRVGIGVSVDRERRRAAISAAWRNPDTGVALTEVIDERPGSAWVAARVAEITSRNVGLVALNQVGPSRGIADELDDEHLLRLVQGDYAAACGRFDEGIRSGSVTWDGDDRLAADLRVADWRDLAGGQAWTGRDGVPIPVLEAHTLAVWAADHLPAEEPASYGWGAY